MEYILKTDHLMKKYKKFKAISDVNINIEKGAIYGLIGKNGAGKTTIIRIICGLQYSSSGTYSIYGVKSTSQKKMLQVRKKIGAIIESPAIYNELNAKDNLKEHIKLSGMSTSSKEIRNLLTLVGLQNVDNKKVKNFSLGMKQRLGIAIALASNPDFLILDEPINGLDPEGIVEIRELILKLNKEKGMTILISSHYLDELSKIATHYGFLNNGVIINEISQNELLNKLQQKIELKTKNQEKFVEYFKEQNISYEIVDNESINIYNQTNLSKFIANLSKKNLIADEIHEKVETLEDYYMKLIGGH